MRGVDGNGSDKSKPSREKISRPWFFPQTPKWPKFSTFRINFMSGVALPTTVSLLDDPQQQKNKTKNHKNRIN